MKQVLKDALVGLNLETEDQSGELEAEKSRIIDLLAVSIALALLPISAIVVFFGIRDGWDVISQLQLVAIFLVWGLALNKRHFRPRQLALIITVIMLGGAMGEVIRLGLIAPTFPLLAVLPVVGAAIGGLRWGLFGFGVVCSAVALVAWQMISTEPALQVELSSFVFELENWLVLLVNIVVATGIGVFVVGSLYSFHASSEKNLRERNQELIKSQSRNSQSGKLAGLGYALTNQISGQVLECDEAYAQMHGMTAKEFTALDINSGIIGTLIHEDDRDTALKIKERLLKGEALTAEFRHRLPNGETRFIRKIFAPVTLSGSPDGLFDVVSQDVTDARRLQEQLFQTQKLDAIGKLTGGVAHDFNNLLAVILGNLELLDDKVLEAEEKELIKNGVEATLRGSELTRNMLSFARKAPLAPTIVDLNQLVQNLKNWTARTLPSTIDVETSLLAGLWPAKVDASSAESGLLNLIVNARDVMPQGGKLTIETSNVRIDEDYVDTRGEDLEPGRYVLVAISDTGEGISPEHLKKIFEPFYTTKPVGAGSGLGLSMLEGFMKQSGGTVRVYSEPGVGSTFKLYFPAVTSNVSQERATPVAAPKNVFGKRATLLLVEDNVEVLTALQTMLINSDFCVVAAASGDEALRVFKQGTDIDLLLTDIVMPGELQGTTLAKSLREARPELPVVFMSGYASEATVHGNGLRPEDIRLMKPVRRQDLLRAIDKALVKSAGSGNKS